MLIPEYINVLRKFRERRHSSLDGGCAQESSTQNVKYPKLSTRRGTYPLARASSLSLTSIVPLRARLDRPVFARTVQLNGPFFDIGRQYVDVMKLRSRSLVWLAPFYLCCLAHLAPGQGATYSKIEASFSITGISTDPAVLFDYTQTDVEVGILQPDSSTVTLPAFYDGGTTWRMRHTPTMTGNYQITGIQLNGAPISVGNLQPTNWIVTGFPSGAGFVRVDPKN